jgi:transcriptional regulator with XRE-family HTH domain
MLNRVGIPQRRIAALTGQAQSEISEILAGRQVQSYALLTRVADGLGLPRGWLGVAHDEDTTHLLEQPPRSPANAHRPTATNHTASVNDAKPDARNPTRSRTHAGGG